MDACGIYRREVACSGFIHRTALCVCFRDSKVCGKGLARGGSKRRIKPCLMYTRYSLVRLSGLTTAKISSHTNSKRFVDRNVGAVLLKLAPLEPQPPLD